MPTRPDFLPEKFWDADKHEPKGADFKAHLESLEKVKAENDARWAAVPAKPELYKAELPKDFKAPEGFRVDEKDPEFAAFRAYAHANGLSQEQVSNLLAIRATAVLAKNAQLAEAIKARDAALGENGPARVDALSKFFDTYFQKDPQLAREVKSAFYTPGLVKIFEHYQKLVTGQGASGFSGIGRDGQQPERDDGKPRNWDKMSPIDRRAWQLAQARGAGKAA